MKRLFTFLSATIMLLFAGCGEEYVDPDVLNRLDNLEDRLERLEELCTKLNTNIASLQTIITALQNNDYITGVTPITKAGEIIGYTISFTKSAPITIYHGEDGKDGQNGLNGQDGKDGSTPVIGVRQDSDNTYYWTVNGEWLLDENGNKIKAEGKDGENGQNGTNGTNGTNGENGKDGITPQLKIENDYWMISYDNGTSWTQLGKATGEKGEQGEKGDQTFQSVTQDKNNVYFTLNDGTTITIPLQPKLAITFSVADSLLFEINETKTVQYTITGGSDKNVVKAELQNLDDGYTLRTTPTDSKSGTISIIANIPTDNSVIVSVSDGAHTIMSAIKVSIKPKFEEGVITVTTPGTLASLLEDYDKTTITELKVIGNLNDSDISTLNRLPALSILDMEEVNLEELPYNAFRANKILSSIKLPKTLKTIKGFSLAGCKIHSDLSLPSGITTIEKYALYESSISGDLILPQELTSIASYAFSSCKTTGRLILPQGLTSIGGFAFNGCEFTGELVLPQGLTSIGNSAFNGCKFTGELVLPQGLTSIGNSAFNGCKFTGELILPQGLTSIGNGTFGDSTFTGELVLPQGLTSIGNSAFEHCNFSGKLILPQGLTSIGYRAFQDCKFTEIYCKATTPPQFGNGAIINPNKIYVPTTSVEAYKSAEGWSNYASIITGYDFE